MTELTNEELIRAVPSILASLHVTPLENLHFSTWRVLPAHKILIAGVQDEEGKKIPVRLKVRTPGQVNPREKFIQSETVARHINDWLAQGGLPAQKTIKVNFDSPPEWILRLELAGAPVGNHSFRSEIDSTQLIKFVVELRQALDQMSQGVNRALLNHRDWQAQWLKEFNQREGFVSKHLGPEMLNTLKLILSQPLSVSESSSIIHTDLAPANILQGQNGFFVIDWGEAAWGPKAIDWMTVWSFAYDRPELGRALLKAMFDQCQTEAEKNETVQVAKMMAARLLSSFAEWYDYYDQPRPGEKPAAIQEARQALPLARQRFVELLQQLG